MITYQADADLNQMIVFALRRHEPLIDFRTATNAGLTGIPDPDVLAVTAEADRVLVTHDKRTMPDHFAEFIQNIESPGVIVVPQSMPIRLVVDELLLIWGASEPNDWRNRILYLPL